MAFLKVGELWMKRDKRGRQYLSGYVKGGKHLTRSPRRLINICAYPNAHRYKKEQSHFLVYIQTFDKPKKKEKDA